VTLPLHLLSSSPVSILTPAHACISPVLASVPPFVHARVLFQSWRLGTRAAPWKWMRKSKASRDGREGRRGGGIQMGMRGRGRGQKVGMRSYCAALCPPAQAWSVTRLQYGYGAQIR
jgi:hypothetical protein